MKLFTSVGLGWLLRRIPDWGGWIAGFAGLIFALFSQLDPDTQAELSTALQQLVTGQWREVTLGHVATLFGIVALFWSQRKSYTATVTPQVVTGDGKKAGLDDVTTSARTSIEVIARNAVEAKPDGPVIRLLKRVFGK